MADENAKGLKKLEEPVTWKGLTVMLIAMVGLNLTIGKGAADQAERVAKSAVEQADKKAQSISAELAEVRQQVARNKVEADAGVAEVRKDIQALYLFQVTRQRQPRLEKEKQP